jgi:hypothetical protein
MKTARIILYISIAMVTCALGIGWVATVRLASSSMFSLLQPTKVTEQPKKEIVRVVDTELLAKPIFSGPSLVEYLREKETRAQAVATSQYEFDPSGEYYMRPTNVPKAFAKVGYISIDTNDYTAEDCAEELMVPEGSLETTKTFKMKKLVIVSHKISFQTVTVGGISYRFTGRLVDKGDSDEDAPDLKGQLIMIKNGKWAAEMEAEFELGGC